MEDTQEQVAASTEVVVVRLGGGRFCLPMAAVAEVGRPPALTRVPGVPAWLAGVANWRGRVLAVLDLRPLLTVENRRSERAARLVVLHHASVTVGLLTEGVDGTRTLTEDQVETSLAHLAGSAADLLAGQTTDAEGPVGVLDLEAVYRLAEALPRARRAG